MTIEGTAGARRRQRPRAGRPAAAPVARPPRLETGDEDDIYDPYPPDEDGQQGISGERIDIPANPYAPTGWQAKTRVEFDIQMPSGQMCRIMRLEREDLFRLNLMDYLDTFTPMLLGDMGDEEREALVQETIETNPEALKKMLAAIDQVVMACTLRPKLTEDPDLVNMGTPRDWANPDFTATIHLDNVPTEERMFIFGSAFGKSMDDLKSVWAEATGVGSLDDQSVVQRPPQ